MSGMKLFLLYDKLAQDIMNVFPCPSINSAILGFANSKKGFDEKGYNPRLLELYYLGDVDVDTKSQHVLFQQNFNFARFVTNLADAPAELERITNEMLDEGAMSPDDIDD